MKGQVRAEVEVPVRIVQVNPRRRSVVLECHGKQVTLRAGDVLNVRGFLNFEQT